jgi:hypothetical protein
LSIKDVLLDKEINISCKLIKAWSKETAHPAYQNKWSLDNPSAGQCLVTALLIQELKGGEIASCKVGNCSHFINVINGQIEDYTSGQFKLPIKYKKISLRERKILLENKDTLKRYELLKRQFFAF